MATTASEILESLVPGKSGGDISKKKSLGDSLLSDTNDNDGEHELDDRGPRDIIGVFSALFLSQYIGCFCSQKSVPSKGDKSTSRGRIHKVFS